MNKAVLISIRPEWCNLILCGKKTSEVRKRYPKAPDLPRPFKCYIYRTQIPGRLIDIIKDGDKLDYYLPEGEEPTIYHGKPTFIKTMPDKGGIVAEFECDIIENLWSWSLSEYVQPLSGCTCLTAKEIADYANGKPAYGWHISNLKKYPHERPLSDFGLKRPPQSYCYVEELPG